MHILVIPSWFNNDYEPGKGIFFEEQAKALSKNGNKVTILSVMHVSIKDIYKRGKIFIGLTLKQLNTFRVYRFVIPNIPKISIVNKLIKCLIFRSLIKKYVKEHGKPDVVHLHSYIEGDIVLWMKTQYGIKFVVTEHYTGFIRENLTNKQMDKARIVLKESSARIAVSEHFSKHLSNLFNIDFSYIPNMIDTNYFENKKYNKNKKIFLNIGYLEPKKNHRLLIDSFRKVIDENIDAHLIIVGSGPEQKNLKRYIESIHMENIIELYGYANREQILELLNRASCFVLTSEVETFGVVLIEAMSCGIPVVSTRSGGPDSILGDDNDNEFGYLCNRKVDDVANAMKKVLSRKFDSDKIREYVRNNYAEEVVVEKIEYVYKDVLGVQA